MKIYFIRFRFLAFILVLTFALMFGIIVLFQLRCPPVQDVFYAGLFAPSVVIDAGHGGIDGGAVSASGLTEAPLNLDISLRLRDLLTFAGIGSVLTRETADSLDYSEANSIKQNKSADLNARLAISRSYPDCPFLSIHLNKYVQNQYSGAQVFYSPNHAAGITLAGCLQEKMRYCLDPGNDRRAKLAPDGVYLMKHISAPAVTIECGFLSNAEEAARLATESYRLKIAASICCGYIDYLKVSDLQYAS